MKFTYTILFILLSFTFVKAQSVCGIIKKHFIDDRNVVTVGPTINDSLHIRSGSNGVSFLNGHQANPILSLFDSTYIETRTNFYENNAIFNDPGLSGNATSHLFRNQFNLDTLISSFNMGMPSLCFNFYSYDVFTPIDDANYIGTTLKSFNSTNNQYANYIINGDTISIFYGLDNLNTNEYNNPNVFLFKNICNSSLLYPSCSQYKLSFYIRPYKYVSHIETINSDTIFINNSTFTKQCIYSSQDYIFMDSLQLDFYEKPFEGKFDSAIIENNFTKLSDTTQWTKVEYFFSPSDTTILLSLTPHFDFDTYFLIDSNGMRYKAIVDSLNALPNTSDNLYYGDISLYYLFDSISLVPIGYENLDLCLPDTSFCESFSINVDAYQPEFTRYEWSTGDTTSSINIDSAGTYTLSAYYPCGVICDEFTVFEEPANYLLPLSYADTLTICEQNLPITLNAADTFATYLWSNGDTTFSSSFNQEGMVYLETEHFCGTLIDSVYINIIEAESLNINDTTICANQTNININANPNFDTYLWSNGDTTASSSFDTAGIYWVQAFYLCDTLTDTFQVFEEPTLILNYADTLEFCATDLPITLQAADTFQNYLWSNNATAFSSTFNQEGMVYLETEHFCGTLIDSVYINVIETEILNINDTTICANQTNITINANPNFDTYLWSNGDTTVSSSFDTAGIYWIQAFYLCDTLTDTFQVFEEPTLILNYADTLEFCATDLPITLQAADTFQNYLWNNGDTTFSTQVNQEGMVYLETQHFCGTLRDSVYLKLRDKQNLDLISFKDTLFCASDLPFALQINDTLQNYVWSNGGNTFQNTFDAAGTYFVSADNGCHYYTDTFTVQTENLATGNFKHQNIYCPEDFPITLTAPSALNPNWNTGENTNSITVNNAVNDVYVHNSFSAVCGNRTDSFFVYVLPDTITSLPQILIDDFCLEEGFYQFSTIVNDTNFVYQWENQTSLNFTTKGGTTQTLSISNACLSLEIDTFIERCPEQIAFALPTAFSPNNDGVNDVFKLLYLNPNFNFGSLKIYNRWGELIFNSTDKTIGWDGIYKNQNTEIGTYIYHLELENENQKIETFKGNLSLIR